MKDVKRKYRTGQQIERDDIEGGKLLRTMIIVIVLGLLAIWGFFHFAEAQEAGTYWGITLVWDANTEPDLDKYQLYYSDTSFGGMIPEGMDPILEVPRGTETAQYTVGEGTSYFVLTAVDLTGNESPPSGEA